MESSLSPIRSLRGHTGWVGEVFSKNRNQLKVISTSFDETVRIWDVETGEQEHSLEGHTSLTLGLAVSMDGRRIVSGARDGRIITWDADTKEIIRCLSHHTDDVNCIQFSLDEKRFTFASSDGTLKIWDTETEELVFDIDDYQDKVWTVAYSPNGSKIASGSYYDQAVRIWNAATGKQQTQPVSHGDAVRSIVWSPDSRRLISACNWHHHDECRVALIRVPSVQHHELHRSGNEFVSCLYTSIADGSFIEAVSTLRFSFSLLYTSLGRATGWN
ncbi:WD40-repeat-containing domain protein [Suillus variegatus]|nr:WD40-repeat-containing domain protein [Suillus variegatus]